MFTHTKKLQHPAKPDRPDPLFAKKMQEILGGQYGKYPSPCNICSKDGIHGAMKNIRIF